METEEIICIICFSRPLVFSTSRGCKQIICSDGSTQIVGGPLRCTKFMKRDFNKQIQEKLDSEEFLCDDCQNKFHPTEFVGHRYDCMIKHKKFPDVIFKAEMHCGTLNKQTEGKPLKCYGSTLFKEKCFGDKIISLSKQDPAWGCGQGEIYYCQKCIEHGFFNFDEDDVNFEFSLKEKENRINSFKMSNGTKAYKHLSHIGFLTKMSTFDEQNLSTGAFIQTDSCQGKDETITTMYSCNVCKIAICEACFNSDPNNFITWSRIHVHPLISFSIQNDQWWVGDIAQDGCLKADLFDNIDIRTFLHCEKCNFAFGTNGYLHIG